MEWDTWEELVLIGNDDKEFTTVLQPVPSSLFCVDPAVLHSDPSLAAHPARPDVKLHWNEENWWNPVKYCKLEAWGGVLCLLMRCDTGPAIPPRAAVAITNTAQHSSAPLLPRPRDAATTAVIKPNCGLETEFTDYWLRLRDWQTNKDICHITCWEARAIIGITSIAHNNADYWGELKAATHTNTGARYRSLASTATFTL